MRLWSVWLALLLLFAGCSSMQVTTDYNPDYDFSKLKKTAILYPKNSDDTVTLAQQRFAKAIAEQMRQKGFIITDKEHADFYTLFHLNVTERRQIVTDYQMVGVYPYYPGYYGYGMAVPIQHEYTWTEGKFIVDTVDPRDNRIFWRGVATDRLKEFDTPRERIEYIRKVVAEVLNNFPPKPNNPKEKK